MSRRAILLGLAALAVLSLSVLALWTGVLSIRGEDVRIDNGDVSLAGTLALPRFGKAPYPAAVIVHGSGRTTRRALLGYGRRLAPEGMAVLMYDKRGVGESGGSYPSFSVARCEELFRLLAGDVLAAVDYLKQRDDIDSTRIGLVGGSQAGWIIPLAASASPDVAFMVIVSGPAVSCGQEDRYSQLTGDDPGPYENLTDEEIDRLFREFAGPHGYDPLPVLRTMTAPSLWILGGKDRSVPTDSTVAALEKIASHGNDTFTVRVFPEGDHDLRDAQTGQRIDYWSDVEAWLRDRGLL